MLKPQVVLSKKIDVPPGETLAVELPWKPGKFTDDYYAFAAELWEDGRCVDREESAFVAWSPAVVAAGPRVRRTERVSSSTTARSFSWAARTTGARTARSRPARPRPLTAISDRCATAGCGGRGASFRSRRKRTSGSAMRSSNWPRSTGWCSTTRPTCTTRPMRPNWRRSRRRRARSPSAIATCRASSWTSATSRASAPTTRGSSRALAEPARPRARGRISTWRRSGDE